MTSDQERTYALTKVAPGDYLLPSNDAQTVWRIARYFDGPSWGIIDWPRDREVWGIWRWNGEPTYVDTTSWDRWDMWGGPFSTRAEAIRAALRTGTGTA